MQNKSTPDPSETIEIAPLTYGFGAKRKWLVLSLSGVVLTVVAQTAIMGSMPEYANYLPLVGVPAILALVVPMFLGSRGRSVHLRIQGASVQLQSGRGTWVGAVESTRVVPWLVAGLGTTQGATLVLDARDREGKPKTFALAATGSTVAVDPQATGGTVEPEFFIQPLELQRLVAHFFARLNGPQRAAVRLAEHRFVLVRRPRLGDAFAQALPWMATMAVLGTAGVLLGERAAAEPKLMLLFALFSVLLIGLGLYKTIQRSQAPKPRFELTVQPTRVSVARADGGQIWLFEGRAPLQRETYVYRTRYGTHRFPILRLGHQGSELRLSVWDPSFSRDGDPKGRAPDFLVGVPDWQRLEQLLERLLL